MNFYGHNKSTDISGEEKNNNREKKWIFFTITLVIITNLFTFAACSFILRGNLVPQIAAKGLSKAETVKNAINKYYLGKIDSDKIDTAAAKAEVAQLNDPYSVYMDKTEYKQFNTETDGSFSGVGLQVGIKDGKVVVVAPIDGSPSEKAGILAGDFILKIDNKEVTDKDIDKVADMIKGPINTNVVLTIQRGNKTTEYTIKRENIVLNPVKSELLSNSIGYIKFSEFDKGSAEKFNTKLKELQNEKIKGLILDLRGNPGGLLDEAVYLTSNFVPKDKVIVSIKDKNNKAKSYYSVGGIANGLSLVVLVDGGSASASEVFSGAIKDYNAGTLVGEKTFGKGIVQSIIDDALDGFGDGTALKITTAKYYSPKGTNIHGIGITPDVVIKYPEELKQKPYDRNLDPQFAKALEVIQSKIK